MSEVKINARLRTEFGKGGARRTRRAGMVPAVLYGHGEQPKHISLPAREFAAAIRHGGTAQVFNIDVDGGGVTLALAKAIQRDPIKDTFEHVDLLIVRRGERITIEVPVRITGEPARDTVVTHEHDTLAVTADATQLPDHLSASIDGLQPGSRVTAGQVELPSGVELAADPSLVLAAITGSTSAAELAAVEAEEAAEAAEAAEATEGLEETGHDQTPATETPES